MIRYEAERELYVAERNVHILQRGRSLTARWVAFSKKTGHRVSPRATSSSSEDAERLQAAFMVFDVDTLQGTLYHVAFDSGSDGFRLRAKEMIRTGKNTFTRARQRLHDLSLRARRAVAVADRDGPRGRRARAATAN